MRTEILRLLRESEGYVSGQQLCDSLGVSRTAVWKVIQKLQEDGYRIEAVRNKGYRLREVPDILGEAELASIRRTQWLGSRIYYYQEIDSTNTQAKRLAEEGAAHGSVVVAEVQTVGRGRRGRNWISVGGSGIWFSLLLRPDIPPDRASMLTLVAAMAVTKGIRRITGRQVMIKWPNDVVVDGKKVCGILTELSAQIDYVNHVIVGIGINIRGQQFPPELQEKATTLEQGQQHIDRAWLLEAVLEEFEAYYEKFVETLDVSLFQEEYEELLVNRNRQIQVLDPAGPYEGVARGINEKGELLVECGRGLVTVNSGEVSVRGIYGYT